jgi:hypothetical protein
MCGKVGSPLRIGLLFHKDPLLPAASIDLVRLRALSQGMRRLGADVSIVAPVARTGRLGPIPVLPLDILADKGRFDILKACYHFSLELLDRYDGPLVCRLVRVVDARLPMRDASVRERLLACQEIARERARGVICNNAMNVRRWRKRYGPGQHTVVIPTGCPVVLPPPGPSPFVPGLPPILFLGSLASGHMAAMLSEAAERLQGQAVIHFVGKNKTGLYAGRDIPVSPRIVVHGEVEEDAVWSYVRHARIGLALAAGPELFDNDLSKIVAYLRGGLPVLGEARLANARLFARPGFGAVFRYGDGADLENKARQLLRIDFDERRTSIMSTMVTGHSWDQRAEALLEFCRHVVAAGTACATSF